MQIINTSADNHTPPLPGIKGDDYVMIILEKEKAHNARELMQVLRENGFEVDSQGALGTEYALTAKRLLH